MDYRGYGRSTGTPTVIAMMADCRVILAFAREWLEQRSFAGPLVVMGRSLGSASALELAASHPDLIDGLIIESGFAHAGPLLTLLGVDLKPWGSRQTTVFTRWTRSGNGPGPFSSSTPNTTRSSPLPRASSFMRPARPVRKPCSRSPAPATTTSCRWASPPIW